MASLEFIPRSIKGQTLCVLSLAFHQRLISGLDRQPKHTPPRESSRPEEPQKPTGRRMKAKE